MKLVMEKQEWLVLEPRELMKAIWGRQTWQSVNPGGPDELG